MLTEKLLQAIYIFDFLLRQIGLVSLELVAYG